MIRYKQGKPSVILSENEIEFLANLYSDIKDKTKSFEEFLEEYKKNEIQTFLNSRKKGEKNEIPER